MFWKKINKALSLDEESEIAVATNTPVFVNSVTTTPKEVITSQTIQKDLTFTLENLLEEMSKPFTIEENLTLLKATKENFEKENADLSKRIETLKELGFNNTPSVKVLEANISKIQKRYEEETKTLEDTLKYNAEVLKANQEYALKYPSFKFVPRKAMIEILKKYGLILGEASMYTREIPDSALKIISQFSEEIKDSTINVILQRPDDYRDSRFYQYMYIKETAEDIQRKFISSDDYLLSRINRLCFQHITTQTSLKMVAPFDHFHIPSNAIIDSNNMIKYSTRVLEQEAERRRLEDPIACLEVPMGYIILAAWDKEAEIPEIKNPLLN